MKPESASYRFDIHNLLRHHIIAVSILIIATINQQSICVAQQAVNATAETRAVMQLPDAVQAQLNRLQAELKSAQDKHDARAEAAAFNALGDLYFDVSAYKQALSAYGQELDVARSIGDVQLEVAALNGTGDCQRKQSHRKDAVETYNAALEKAKAGGDQRGQAAALNGLGWILRNTGKPREATETFNHALTLAQSVGDKRLMGSVLRGLGAVQDDLGELHKALGYYEQAIANYREAGDQIGEAATMGNIGAAYEELGEMQKALDFYAQALPMLRAAGARSDVAINLTNTGNVYNVQGDLTKALEYYSQSLPVFKELANLSGAGLTLDNMGALYRIQGNLQQALDAFQQATSFLQQAGDVDNEAATLTNIATVYADLGDIQGALNSNQRALLLFQQVHDRSNEASTLVDMGIAYKDLGDTQKALERLEQALPILRETGNRDHEADALDTLGVIYEGKGDTQKALEYLNQALVICQELGDRRFEVNVLQNIGGLHFRKHDNEQALKIYNQAIALAVVIGDRINEANISSTIMLSVRTQHPALAIYFGKRAVNLIQQVRGNIKGLDKDLQKTFLDTKSSTYRELADLLIAQGRLPEAQQVLDLLKEQEYSDYVRGENHDTLGALALTPAEKQANDEYNSSTGQLVALGQQWAELKKNRQRTPEQEQQFKQLSTQIDQANKSFSDYLGHLYELFGKNAEANKLVAEITGESRSLQQIIAKMPNTVALYTITGEDRCRVIVITGAAMVARESEITSAELNKKVAAFLDMLHDPAKDPKPLAQELYKILIAPVKSDLDQAHAATLVFSLDGVLRYIPMEALYDGRQYLVERYGIVTFDPASLPYLNEKPDVSNLSATALGISRQYETGLKPLPSVEGELNDIVKDPNSSSTIGVLPGSILLNGKFTEAALEQQLDDQHAVLHIASHFVLKPGDDTQSYLLLAGKDKAENGYHLTVAEFRDNPRLSLSDTTLLTLSACETGVTSNASNGREVDGLAMIAQRDKHAKSVLSTLWPVNDASTGLLMADFYKRWAEGGGSVMKVEALRQAQLDMLHGKLTPQSVAANRGVISEEAKPYTPAGFTHPYYWAPFVLMGNWR